MITDNAPVPARTVKCNANCQIIDVRRSRQQPYMKHYQCHLLDSDWSALASSPCKWELFSPMDQQYATAREVLTRNSSTKGFVAGTGATDQRLVVV